MELTDDQKQAIRKWAAAGQGLTEIQKALAEEYGLSPTFMDLRFLLIDLGITLQDKAQAFSTATELGTPNAAGNGPPAGPAGIGPDTPDTSVAGGVRVEVSAVTQPGAVVNGTVTFSDGVSAQWALDQLGRIAIHAGQAGYKPSEADMADFQDALRQELQKRGF